MNKFSIGDRVRFLANTLNSNFYITRPLIGKEYVVTDTHADYGTLRVHGLDGYFGYSRFEKVTQKTPEQVSEFIIVLKEKGIYMPAATPRTYSSEAQAHHVAKEMAIKHGGRFVVFQTVAYAERPAVPEVKIVEII
jgi:hypothetical protein